MENKKMESWIINVLTFLSAGISYIFTILMLLNFASGIFDGFLFLICGLIIDGTKWFSLITFLKHYKNGNYGNFVTYLILFVLFFTVSIIASISYSTYTVTGKMYKVEIIENENYKNISTQIDKAKLDIHSLESEKSNEIVILNKELEELPLDYITRRKELSNRKMELINFYDEKINILKVEIENKSVELSKIDNTPMEKRTLIDNSISNFFQTISNVTKMSVDNLVFLFGLMLGIIFDLPTVAITAGKFRKENVVEKVENIPIEIPQIIPQKVAYVENRNSIPLVEKENSTVEKPVEEKREWRSVESENVEKKKVDNYDKFIERMTNEKLDFKKVMYKDFKDLMASSSFYKCKDRYKVENNK